MVERMIIMAIKYHEGIMYPKEEEKLSSLIEKKEKQEEAKALILPHFELSLSASLINLGFTHISENVEKVIVLIPLHNHRLKTDQDYFYFEGKELITERMFKLGLREAEYYREEESSSELYIPFIERLTNSKYAIIYTDITSSKESKEFSLFLKKIIDAKTLLIISTNLSDNCATIEEMKEKEERAINALKEEKPIIDLINKHQIFLCGGGIVDSVNRVIKGPWIFEKKEKRECRTSHALLWK